jgi:NAD(P)-dependent dehydrogenase (short-subunit alcohol dehydrogenase family)
MTNVSVVVGGASGIGAAVAAAQKDAGRTVLTWDIAPPYDLVCDIRDPDQVETAMSDTVERVGVPDQVTISAGVGHGGPLLDIEPDEWDRVMAINARGPWLTMRAAARAMIDAQLPRVHRGHIEHQLPPGRSHHGRVLLFQGRPRHAGEGGGP